MGFSNSLFRLRAIWQTLSSLLRLRLRPEAEVEDLLIAAFPAVATGMFPVEPPPTSCAARRASSRDAALLLALAAASMKLRVEISSARDLLKRELILLPNARVGDEAEGTL